MKLHQCPHHHLNGNRLEHSKKQNLIKSSSLLLSESIRLIIISNYLCFFFFSASFTARLSLWVFVHWKSCEDAKTVIDRMWVLQSRAASIAIPYARLIHVSQICWRLIRSMFGVKSNSFESDSRFVGHSLGRVCQNVMIWASIKLSQVVTTHFRSKIYH